VRPLFRTADYIRVVRSLVSFWLYQPVIAEVQLRRAILWVERNCHTLLRGDQFLASASSILSLPWQAVYGGPRLG
jgi:ribosome maturation factor RimP